MHIVDYQIVENEKDILPTAEEFALYNSDQEEGGYGGKYHGNMNINHREPFANYQEAYDYIERYTQDKFYYDMAVRFYDNESLPSTKKENQLKAKIQIETQILKDYILKNKLTNRKSAFFGCPTCGSKIARQYFENPKFPERIIVECPVCKTDLRSETVLKRIKTLEEKLIKLKKELTFEKCKHKKGTPIKWLVKIEVHG
jgi:hypothetical protein